MKFKAIKTMALILAINLTGLNLNADQKPLEWTIVLPKIYTGDMSHINAVKDCQELNAHLPSVLELAELSKSKYGAFGLISSQFAGQKHTLIQNPSGAEMVAKGASSILIDENFFILSLYSNFGYKGLTDVSQKNISGLLSDSNMPYGGASYFYYLSLSNLKAKHVCSGICSENIGPKNI